MPAVLQVSAAVPSLLLVLVVLVRDSSNYKIKTHAAAALASLSSRQSYGDCFSDAVLVLAAALDSLDSSSSSNSATDLRRSLGSEFSPVAAGPAENTAADDDGSFPNFR